MKTLQVLFCAMRSRAKGEELDSCHSLVPLMRPNSSLASVQVVWHDREPVLALDFAGSGILATGGGDKTIKVRKIGKRE